MVEVLMIGTERHIILLIWSTFLTFVYQQHVLPPCKPPESIMIMMWWHEAMRKGWFLNMFAVQELKSALLKHKRTHRDKHHLKQQVESVWQIRDSLSWCMITLICSSPIIRIGTMHLAVSKVHGWWMLETKFPPLGVRVSVCYINMDHFHSGIFEQSL